MSIREWPQQEKPREKLLVKGAQSLSDAELLAIFLRTGIAGTSAIALGRQLLAKFGSLRGILELDERVFCQQAGLGSAKYAQLQGALELSRRHLLETLCRENALTSASLSRRYVSSCLRSRKREVFLCLFLDSQHRVLAQEELFEGTIDGAMVHPREGWTGRCIIALQPLSLHITTPLVWLSPVMLISVLPGGLNLPCNWWTFAHLIT